MNSKNYKYLCYTNKLPLLSLFYFARKVTVVEVNTIEIILSFLSLYTAVFSHFFWSYPKKHSLAHKIDAFVSRITVTSFVAYILVYKCTLSYLFVVSMIFTTFYYSNYYSSQEWCSNKHLCWHAGLHIVCAIASFYAFL